MALKRGRLDHMAQHVAPSAAPTGGGGPRWDVVLHGGRVVDPASGLDAITNVAVAGDRIAAVGDDVDPADAAVARDCTGLVVCPGFIDLHAHGQNNESCAPHPAAPHPGRPARSFTQRGHRARLQACDGVTTQLELELGTWPVDTFLAQRKPPHHLAQPALR